MGREKVVLVDTSSWIEALRTSGAIEIRDRVRKLMLDGQAVWCDMVLLELWTGARGKYEKEKLSEMEREIECLPTSKEVWKLACALARGCRNAGKTFPPSDILIASCAAFHEVALEHCDTHLESILEISKRMN